ncbi:MAG TPA: right-handed parallel beta-helix repeat-containing protein [Nitrospira sp.]|nr:right-handed parallel beta-helix repeat-containing protein [Nitrospira sp.]
MAIKRRINKSHAHLFAWGLSILFLFVGVVVSEAATYYVAPNGDDANSGSDLTPFKTIQRGMRSLVAGDTLNIRGGIYPERINSNSQTIPTGNSWSDAPVIAAFPGEMVVLQPAGGAEVVNLAHPYIKYVVFRDLVLDGSGLQRTCSSGYGCSYGVSVTNGAHHVRFSNTEIKNAGGSGILMTRGSSSTPTAIEFIGCNVHHNGVEARDHGFYLATSGNLVRNCKVHDNAGYGVHIYTGNTSVTADNNTIDGNDVYGNATTSGSAPGILVDNGTGNLVMNNVVRLNKNGIQVGNPWTSAATASLTKVYNNTVYNNMPGLGIDIFASSSQTEVKNNIVYKNGGAIGNKGVSTVTSNNLLTDPKFVDELGGNFKLQSTSPAVNQGVILSLVPIDLAGVTRPQLGTHDMGAYEFTSTSGDTTPPAQPVIRSISTP